MSEVRADGRCQGACSRVGLVPSRRRVAATGRGTEVGPLAVLSSGHSAGCPHLAVARWVQRTSTRRRVLGARFSCRGAPATPAGVRIEDVACVTWLLPVAPAQPQIDRPHHGPVRAESDRACRPARSTVQSQAASDLGADGGKAATPSPGSSSAHGGRVTPPHSGCGRELPEPLIEGAACAVAAPGRCGRGGL
jgi:hypothetical protein